MFLAFLQDERKRACRTTNRYLRFFKFLAHDLTSQRQSIEMAEPYGASANDQLQLQKNVSEKLQ